MRAPATMLLRLLALVGKELVEVAAPAGRAAQPRPRTVPDHGRLRTRLQRRPTAARDGRRRPTRLRPADRREELPGTRRRRAPHQRRRPDDAAGGAGPADGSIDVVVVAPADAEAQFKAGKHSVIEVVVNTVDPFRADYAGFLAVEPRRTRSTRRSSARRSRRARATRRPQAGQTAAVIPPEVVAAPTEAELTQRRPVRAARPAVLRAGRPRADPPAPRGDAGRAGARARAHERRHRAVPGRPGQRLGGHGGQGRSPTC